MVGVRTPQSAGVDVVVRLKYLGLTVDWPVLKFDGRQCDVASTLICCPDLSLAPRLLLCCAACLPCLNCVIHGTAVGHVHCIHHEPPCNTSCTMLVEDLPQVLGQQVRSLQLCNHARNILEGHGVGCGAAGTRRMSRCWHRPGWRCICVWSRLWSHCLASICTARHSVPIGAIGC